jgi:iron complex outermembrane receptor protein
MDYHDLERAEVLRGPQGALYGRNAMGGAISLISKKPTREYEAEVAARYGELDLLGSELLVNVPMGEHAALRVSHVEEHRGDGFYSDINGDPLDDLSYKHTRVSLRYQPSDRVDMNYVFDRQDESAPPTVRLQPSWIAGLGSEFNTYADSRHETTHDVKNHNLTVDVTLPGGVLTSVSNYRERRTAMVQDGDFFTGSPALAQQRQWAYFQESDVDDIVFQELRYVANGTRRFKWLVGADYSGSSNNDLIDNQRGAFSANQQIRNTELRQNSWAAFCSAEYRFANQPIMLAGELRYAVDNVDGDLVLYRGRDLTTPERDFGIDETYENLPFSASAAYAFERLNSMAYAKVSSSYRQGGMNDGPGHPLQKYEARLSYDEEKALAYELGWKSSLLDRSLTLNAAVHYTFYDDYIAARDNGCPDECSLTDQNGNALGFNADGTRVEFDSMGNPGREVPPTYFLDNVGDAEAWGMIAELSYRKQFKETGGTLLFNLGWSREKGEVKSLDDDVSNAVTASALGADLSLMRPNQWKSQLVFRQPCAVIDGLSWCSNARLLVSATYVYESGGVWHLDRNTPKPMDSETRLNARIGVETDTWSFTLNGRNITDEDFRTWENFRNEMYRRIDPAFYYAEFSIKL